MPERSDGTKQTRSRRYKRRSYQGIGCSQSAARKRFRPPNAPEKRARKATQIAVKSAKCFTEGQSMPPTLTGHVALPSERPYKARMKHVLIRCRLKVREFLRRRKPGAAASAAGGGQPSAAMTKQIGRVTVTFLGRRDDAGLGEEKERGV